MFFLTLLSVQFYNAEVVTLYSVFSVLLYFTLGIKQNVIHTLTNLNIRVLNCSSIAVMNNVDSPLIKLKSKA